MLININIIIIVRAKQCFVGNCRRCNIKGISVGVRSNLCDFTMIIVASKLRLFCNWGLLRAYYDVRFTFFMFGLKINQHDRPSVTAVLLRGDTGENGLNIRRNSVGYFFLNWNDGLMFAALFRLLSLWWSGRNELSSCLEIDYCGKFLLLLASPVHWVCRV